LFSFGVVTIRDEWVYSDDQDDLVRNVGFLINVYDAELRRFAHIRDANEISNRLDT
jgi:predicted helicase